jgi:hypothetical protein
MSLGLRRQQGVPMIGYGSNRTMTKNNRNLAGDRQRGLPGRFARLAGLIVTSFSLGGCVVAVAPVQSAGAASGYGYTCYAGVYVCRTPAQVPVGSQCSCPGIGAPSFGTVR